MARKQTVDPDDEISALADRLETTIDFVEHTQHFPSGPAIRGIIENAVGRRDLRALRLICRDVDAMLVALDRKDRDALEAVLSKDHGVDRGSEQAELNRQVASIIRRGTIASERERRRLEDYLENLQATGGDAATIERLRQLLRSS